ncbi:MAG: hypothetical protein A2Z47_04270 [Thermodesulfovibrio sp. RBG_19FT_COMBO_42_12]|nr:MAG: hypothetical protein A2Z47_04270 [Thermodesulfovibrio sp. RBG_19FT_COMBO_42_12]
MYLLVTIVHVVARQLDFMAQWVAHQSALFVAALYKLHLVGQRLTCSPTSNAQVAALPLGLSPLLAMNQSVHHVARTLNKGHMHITSRYL